MPTKVIRRTIDMAGLQVPVVELLGEAETLAKDADMSLYVAACQYHRGILMRGAEGGNVREE